MTSYQPSRPETGEDLPYFSPFRVRTRAYIIAGHALHQSGDFYQRDHR